MERRKFLSLTLGALVLAVAPASVRAEDYRKLKPTVWTAHTVEDAIKNLYGTTTTIEKGVKLSTPDVASSGGAVPVTFSTKIPAKTVSVFQDANPEAAVIVYSVTKYDITDYKIQIKMGKPGTITVVVEGLDGKLYSAKRSLDVALGGCEG
ncbi:thiosulfate oxidation carrier protein SoxY [Sulfurimonas sp.]|uniref:thiosulfate oxidation carrier protein SoxY n=1 Tax=Sulfurimonas sp. TaxID=2022749 RepID=UPI002AAFB62C|nr:thiosulfate oxidation carrier protein SoxY [Sulfurimonas sp.]